MRSAPGNPLTVRAPNLQMFELPVGAGSPALPDASYELKEAHDVPTPGSGTPRMLTKPHANLVTTLDTWSLELASEIAQAEHDRLVYGTQFQDEANAEKRQYLRRLAGCDAYAEAHARD